MGARRGGARQADRRTVGPGPAVQHEDLLVERHLRQQLLRAVLGIVLEWRGRTRAERKGGGGKSEREREGERERGREKMDRATIWVCQTLHGRRVSAPHAQSSVERERERERGRLSAARLRPLLILQLD